MIQPYGNIKIFPIELAGPCQSIILGELPAGKFKDFLKYMNGEPPQYKDGYEERHGKLIYRGLSLAGLEKKLGKLPKLVQASSFEATFSSLPFHDNFIIFADKKNFNAVLIKIIKTLYGKKGEDECWRIYRAYQRQVLFSIFHEFSSYFLRRDPFNELFNKSSKWKIPKDAFPLEGSENISDESLSDLLKKTLHNIIITRYIGGILNNSHMMEEVDPKHFSYDMNYMEWSEAFTKVYPTIASYALGVSTLWTIGAGRFRDLLRERGDYDKLVAEFRSFYKKMFRDHNLAKDFDYLNDHNMDFGLPTTFLDGPIDDYREWAKENPGAFLWFVARNTDTNSWLWNMESL